MEEWNYSGSRNAEPSPREKRNAELSRRLAERAIVLLKNEGVLPIAREACIGLFGNGAGQTVKGGIGSGDVNNRENVSIYQGLKNRAALISSERWIEDYAERYRRAREQWKAQVLEAAKTAPNPFEAYARNPFMMPEGGKILEEDIRHAELIVYVVSRISGEGMDRRLEKGNYYLSEKEEADLLQLNQYQLPIVLMLNAGGPVEITDMLERAGNIRAVLNLSQLGQEGGNAVAAVLCGEAVPEGKLTATWARRYQDYPYGESYSYLNGNLETEDYREGIYVGYRYFDSFGVKPLYAFGYGLSYTDFAISCEGAECREGEVRIQASVRNIGKEYSGREVVQLYLYLPESSGEQERKRLSAFKKTRLLAPGEEERLELSIPEKELAVFREGKGFLIQAGVYAVGIGNSSDSDKLSFYFKVEQETLIEKTEELDFPEQVHFEKKLGEKCGWQEMTAGQEEIERKHIAEGIAGKKEEELLCFIYKPGEIYENAYSGNICTEKESKITTVGKQVSGNCEVWKSELSGVSRKVGALEESIPEERISSSESKPGRFSPVLELETERLLPLFYGNTAGLSGSLGAAGIRVPGSAGETTAALQKEGLPSLIMADGPAGLRLQRAYEVNAESGEIYSLGILGSLENGFLAEQEKHENALHYYQYCTAFPVGTALAQSWDTALLEEFGAAVASEMQEYHVNIWLAPGMNIQKNPLCGRNFEYFSEDPLLSGKLGAAICRGVQLSSGCSVTIKHFAANNQEDNRMSVKERIEEKSLREIYLRGFEIAVKEGKPYAIMSSYNLINGIHTANSYALCTQIARKEWGFSGIIMSDWDTTGPEDGSIPWKCVAAGNDIIMPGSSRDAENIREAYHTGLLSEDCIRESAARILSFMERLR